MFYEVLVTDHVRVEPNKFGMNTDEAVRVQLEESYSGFQDRDIGTVVAVLDVIDVKDDIKQTINDTIYEIYTRIKNSEQTHDQPHISSSVELSRNQMPLSQV